MISSANSAASDPVTPEEGVVQLLGPVEIRQLCAELGVRPTKTWGQNFVHDGGTVRRIVRAAEVVPGDHVLEVGPGLGSLTLALLAAEAAVTAVEIDPVLARQLPATIKKFAPTAGGRLQVLAADALKVDSAQALEAAIPVAPPGVAALATPPTHLVANLPYNVAVPVILNLLEALPSLREVLVMVQAEVADRLAAAPGNRVYGVPSVKAAWYGTARRTVTIGRSVFWPVPNIDSALVSLTRTEDAPAARAARGELPLTQERVFSLIDAAFSQRRKTLRQALKTHCGGAAAAEELLRSAGIDPSLRGERLGIEDFVALATAEARQEKVPPPVGCVATEASTPLSECVSVTAAKAMLAHRKVMVTAPAKVNLVLHVGPVQADGYHPLVTVFQALDIVETMSLQLSDIPGVRLQITGRGRDLPTDERNLVVQAAKSIMDSVSYFGGLDITLHKRIPVAGGMAGGSADAAAALVGMNALLQAGLSTDFLLGLAGVLGADVPAVLQGGTSLGTGRGDQLQALSAKTGQIWVLAISRQGLSTPAVFAQFDELAVQPIPAESGASTPAQIGEPSCTRTGLPEISPEFLAILQAGEPDSLGALLSNDLTAAATTLRPELATTIALARQAGAAGVVLSGSGPTIAALVPNDKIARQVEKAWELDPQVAEVIRARATNAGTQVAQITQQLQPPTTGKTPPTPTTGKTPENPKAGMN